jgi:hypothetical protein
MLYWHITCIYPSPPVLLYFWALLELWQ